MTALSRKIVDFFLLQRTAKKSRLLYSIESLNHAMRDRRTGNGFKVADTSATKSNGAKSARKGTTKPITLKNESVKSNKRTAPAEEESEEELEDFGNVDIDIESDDDEEIQAGDIDDSDGDIDEFPEGNDKDQEENTLVEEEGEEEEDSDDYMAGDSLDEEDWNEEVKSR